jgi:hypothetical protein
MRGAQGSRRPLYPGALLFGYFILGKQDKVTRHKGEKKRLNMTISFKKNKSQMRKQYPDDK